MYFVTVLNVFFPYTLKKKRFIEIIGCTVVFRSQVCAIPSYVSLLECLFPFWFFCLETSILVLNSEFSSQILIAIERNTEFDPRVPRGILVL